MNHRGRHFYFAAVLEAPLWLLGAVFVLVTIAVIATGVAL